MPGQVPACQQNHEFCNHIGSNAHVGNQRQVHSRYKRKRTHDKEHAQDDDRDTVFVFLGTFLRKPALFGRCLKSAGHPAQRSVQGGQQCEHGAAEHKEKIQPGRENLLCNQGQVLERHIFSGQHPGCHDTDQRIENSYDGSRQDDYFRYGPGRFDDIVAVLSNELSAAAGKA